MSNQFFPFGQVPGSNPAQSQAYDLIINEINPGIVLEPTEPNGVYVAIREVGGCSWWALNADYNTDAAQWQQNSPQNAALPAYAIEQCADGTLTRYVAVATNTPGTAVAWVAVWHLDAKGNMLVEPTTATSAGDLVEHLSVTWNGGSPAVMNARVLNVVDTSSNGSSAIDNLIVNGTTVWEVRKDGTLVSGAIPYSLIIGVPAPTYNDVTLTGTTTVAGTLDVDGFADLEAGASVEGGLTVDSFHDTGNSQIDGNQTVNGTSHLIGHVTADNGASIALGLAVTGGETVAGGLTVSSGGQSVTGGLTTDSLHDTGNAQIDGTATINNLTVTGTTTSTGAPLVTLESTDSTVDITAPSANTYDLKVNGSTLPGVLFGSYAAGGVTTPGASNPFVTNVTIRTPGAGAIVTVFLSSPDSGTTFSGTITGGGFSTIPAYEVFTNVQSLMKLATCANGDVITITVNSNPNPATQYIAFQVTQQLL